MQPELILPEWPAPANVRAFQTCRGGGVSMGPYASLNLGDHVGDVAAAVAGNRAGLAALLPGEPIWLQQVHGVAVADGNRADAGTAADAVVARRGGRVCVVMTADCLPILLCDRGGSVVAATHAGWRGLCAGIIEATVAAMGIPGADLLAWLGPAIGPQAFEVGGEVRDAFVARDAAAADAFKSLGGGKWLADIWRLARLRLSSVGVEAVWGGGLCTFRDRERFFSYRRDGVTGRMGTFIWLADRQP